jgi:hypothetical protein
MQFFRIYNYENCFILLFYRIKGYVYYFHFIKKEEYKDLLSMINIK